MKDLVYLSRSFVEFGPFTKGEILDFQKRGLLTDTDYLRDQGTDTWLHYAEWMTIAPMPAPTKVEKKPAADPKAAPKAKAEPKAEPKAEAKTPATKKGKKAA